MQHPHRGSRGHALVIGGSMAGLAAARVLSDHFERVTVIERDDLSYAGDYRPGVPQSRHFHLLLQRGRDVFARLFPELEAEFQRANIPQFNLANDVEVDTWAGRFPRYPSAFVVRSSSRAWLEATLHKHVAARPGIEFRARHEVLSLQVDRTQAVTGVLVRHADQRETIEADLVVDASGRNSKAIEWLASLGFDKPSITTVNSHLGYATRWYERDPSVDYGWRGVITGSVPTSNPRAGVLFPIEGDRWVATIGGLARTYPPTDDEGFLEFVRNFQTPTIYNVLRTLKPISPIYGYRRTENRWVHFEELERWPDRFLVLGDAACCFNPIYGQGMAVSAVEASFLDEALRHHGHHGHQSDDLRGFAQRFQRRLPDAFRPAWLLSTGEDFRWPTTEGGTPELATRFAHWYVDRLFELMPTSPATLETFMTVQHLLAPPTALFHPSMIGRVIASNARKFVASRVNAPAAARGASAE